MALEANVNICTSIISELKDKIKEVNIIFKFKDTLNNCMLFIPLDISHKPIIIAFIILGKFKLLNIIVGINEKAAVYAKIYASVFKLPKMLVDNNSNGEYIFTKLFEFTFVCCIMLLLYDGVKNTPIITAER